MYRFNIKEHNKKVLEMSKKAASGLYPSKKIATVGFIVGITLGIGLFSVGIIGILTKSIWGVGSSFAGVLTIISNVINLKRLKKHS